MLPVQPHEVRPGENAARLQPFRTAFEQHDVLEAATADGLDELSCWHELIDERVRNPRKRGGDEHGIERRVLGEPFATVPHHDLGVVYVVPCEVRAGGLGKVGPALDAPDEGGEAREQGCLEPVTRSDLEDTLRPRQPERLDHPSYEGRLRRDLVVRDGNGCVGVRASGELHRNEARARHDCKSLQHALVGDPVGADRLDEVGLCRCRHGNQYAAAPSNMSKRELARAIAQKQR